MVDGIGTDIVEIGRVQAAIERTPAFVRRIYTEAEAAYCRSKGRPFQHFAGRFAAKEAVIKALGRGVPWNQIEILNDERGKPICTLHTVVRNEAGEVCLAGVATTWTAPLRG